MVGAACGCCCSTGRVNRHGCSGPARSSGFLLCLWLRRADADHWDYLPFCIDLSKPTVKYTSTEMWRFPLNFRGLVIGSWRCMVKLLGNCPMAETLKSVPLALVLWQLWSLVPPVTFHSSGRNGHTDADHWEHPLPDIDLNEPTLKYISTGRWRFSWIAGFSHW